MDDDDNGGDKEDQQLAQLPVGGDYRKRELRSKRKEDTNAQSSSTNRSLKGASAVDLSTSAGPVPARKSRGASDTPPPPFPPMASSSTANGKGVSPRKPELPDLVLTRPHSRSSRATEARSGHSTALTNGEVSSEQLEALQAQVDTLKERLDAKDEENSHLRHELRAAQTVQALDQQKYANLSSEYQQLQRRFQILQLAKQKEVIQAEAQAVRVQKTLAKHDQLLQDREKQRKHYHKASILLQSKIRSRFEQKRFQALKLQRLNAAITLQCFYRVRKARNELRELRSVDRLVKQRLKAASRLQGFVRRQLQHKARAMMSLARQLSAQILQKHARRFVGVRAWGLQKKSVLVLQCWVRQRLAARFCMRLRDAILCIRSVAHVWICKRRWRKVKKSVRRVQRWWRCVVRRLAVLREQSAGARAIQKHWRCRQSRLREEQHDLLVECIEAAVCVQALWRGRNARQQVQTELMAREKTMEQLEAAVRIQEAWRAQRRRYLLIQEGSTSIASGVLADGLPVELSREPELSEELAAAPAEERDGVSPNVMNDAGAEQDGSENTRGVDTDDDVLGFAEGWTLGDECVQVGSESVDERDENVDEDDGEIEEAATRRLVSIDLEREPCVTAAATSQEDRPSRDEAVQKVQFEESEVVVQEQARRAIDDDELEAQFVPREVSEALQCAVNQVCGADLVEEREKSSSEPPSSKSTGEHEGGERDEKSKATSSSGLAAVDSEDGVGVADAPRTHQADWLDQVEPAQEVPSKGSDIAMKEHDCPPDAVSLPPHPIVGVVAETLQCVVDDVCDLDLLEVRHYVRSRAFEMAASEPKSPAEVTGELGAREASGGEAQQELFSMKSARDEPTITDPPRLDPAAAADVDYEASGVPDVHGYRTAPSDVDTSCPASVAQDSEADPIVRHVMVAMLQDLEIGGSLTGDGEVKDPSSTAASTPDSESFPIVSATADTPEPARHLEIMDVVKETSAMGEMFCSAVSTKAQELASIEDAGPEKHDSPSVEHLVKDDQSPGTNDGKSTLNVECSNGGEASSTSMNSRRESPTLAATEIANPGEENESVSEAESESEGERSLSTSVDSSDLMWEADALTSFKGAASSNGEEREEGAPRKKTQARMDSERILADLSRFEDDARKR